MTEPNAAKNQIDLDEFAAIIAPALIDRHWAELKILIAELRASRKVVEAADKVAAYLTIEAEFSGDEAEHSGLYELDAALGSYSLRVSRD